eukprot:39391_1
MSASQLFLVISPFIFNAVHSQISPTITNSSGAFYISSETEFPYFRNASITCNDSYCHIVCDEYHSCYGLKVDATSPSTRLVVQCFGKCSMLWINATTAHSVHLSCGGLLGRGSNVCAGLYLDASNVQNDVNVLCNGRKACANLHLDAVNVQNDVNIVCNGDDVCESTTFNGSNVGNSLTLTCYDNNACEWMDVYCPEDVPCNINCLGSTHSSWASCGRADFHVETVSTAKLNLNCSNAAEGGCAGASIVCEDTGASTSFTFNASEWKCNINRYQSGCCATRGDISCSSGSHCQIDCDAQPCDRHVINATQARSLTLDCGTDGCQFAHVYCPSGDSTSCNIQCTESYSCEDIYIETDANEINELTVDCMGSHSCQYMKLKSKPQDTTQIVNKSTITCKGDSACENMLLFFNSSVIADLTIICNGSSACQDSDFITNVTLNVGNSLTMICDGRLACYDVNVYCPKDGQCNIHCSETPSAISGYGASCHYAQFHVDTQWTETLNLDCSNAPITGCYSARIICHDTQDSTQLTFSDSSQDWGCSNDHCCVIKGHISCPNGSHCQIDCDAQPCHTYVLDATQATSLTLDCGTNGCQFSRIYCPRTGVCTIQCPEPNSCQYMKLKLNSSKITQLSITCGGSNACEHMDVELNDAQITRLYLNCNAFKSCWGLDLSSFAKPRLSYLGIDCTYDSACAALQLSARIASHAIISCGAHSACAFTEFDLISDAPNVTVDIICDNALYPPSYSTTSYWPYPFPTLGPKSKGACHQTTMNIFGHNKTNNVSYLCHDNDCVESTVNISNFYLIDMECGGSNGCEYSLYAETSQHLAVNCSGYKGCENIHVYCPIVGTCNFHCIGNDSCRAMTAEIANDEYHNLNINCIDPVYGCGYDEETIIRCVDSKMYGKLMWFSYYEKMICNGFCCPPNYLPNDKKDSSTSNNPSTQMTHAPSSALSDTVFSITKTTANQEKDDAFDDIPRNEDHLPATVISTIILSLVLIVVGVGVTIYVKKMNDKIKYLQNNHDNAGIEMDDHVIAHQQLIVVDETTDEQH